MVHRASGITRIGLRQLAVLLQDPHYCFPIGVALIIDPALGRVRVEAKTGTRFEIVSDRVPVGFSGRRMRLPGGEHLPDTGMPFTYSPFCNGPAKPLEHFLRETCFQR